MYIRLHEYGLCMPMLLYVVFIHITIYIEGWRELEWKRNIFCSSRSLYNYTTLDFVCRQLGIYVVIPVMLVVNTYPYA